VVKRPPAAFFVFAQHRKEGCCISVEPRINERIRAPQVRLVGADGEQLGIVPMEAARRLASELDLDLVEVAPMARPPVCRLMDYSKFKYEQAIKAKEARRKQSLVVLKEMKMRPKIDDHDYETKKGHVERFLKQGHKVKVTIMFRGREMAHTELGLRLLQRLATDIADIAQVDSPARQDGRNMITVFSPRKSMAAQGGKGGGGTPARQAVSG
jgi:translation initiation factor IF-3